MCSCSSGYLMCDGWWRSRMLATDSRNRGLAFMPASIHIMNVCNEHLCPRRQPYSLVCHGGAMRMYRCALENTTDCSCTQNWVSDSDGSRTLSWSEFQRAGPEYAKLLCSYRFVLQYLDTACPGVPATGTDLWSVSKLLGNLCQVNQCLAINLSGRQDGLTVSSIICDNLSHLERVVLYFYAVEAAGYPLHWYAWIPYQTDRILVWARLGRTKKFEIQRSLRVGAWSCESACSNMSMCRKRSLQTRRLMIKIPVTFKKATQHLLSRPPEWISVWKCNGPVDTVWLMMVDDGDYKPGPGCCVSFLCRIRTVSEPLRAEMFWCVLSVYFVVYIFYVRPM